MRNYFNCHSHTEYSNLRLLDATNHPEDLIKKAVELGLSGIAITDHECLSSAVRVNKIAKKMQETNPDFTIALGNEIYLVDERKSGQKYYHFILIAKDKIGYQALKELSSTAWYYSYSDRGMERVPTTKNELKNIVNKYKGHLIATSACFTQGQKVLTKYGEKNIEDIQSGDEVLNLNGEWESVIEPTCRNYDGVGYEIIFNKNKIPTICTENHQFLVTTNNKLQAYKRSKNKNYNPYDWVAAKDLNIQKGSSKHICLKPVSVIEYSNNIYLKKTEWYKTLHDYKNGSKIHLKENIEITPALMRLFGLFLGDGSISINPNKKYYAINLSFNSQEFNFYWEDFVKEASEQLGITWSKNDRGKVNHKIDLTSHSIELVELFYYLFGNVKANNKIIPKRLLHISKELDYELVFGYMLADGYFRNHQNKEKNISNGELVSASISEQLTKDFSKLLIDLNLPNSIYKKEEYIDKNGVHHNTSWYLSSSNNAWKKVNKLNHNSFDFVKNLFIEATDFAKKEYVEINNIKYQKIYIKEKQKIHINEKVYCLNNTTHSFVLNGSIVHNCIGGELSTNALLFSLSRNVNDNESAKEYYDNILNFIDFCLELFGDDFYIECAPSTYDDQITVNKQLYKIAEQYNIKMVVGTDAHYLRPEDRPVHKAYLNSKGGEREVDSFYEFAYLMNSDEIKELLAPCFPEGFVDKILDNTLEIQNKIEFYDLFHKQDIPKVEVKDYPKAGKQPGYFETHYPNLNRLLNSDDIQDRYWVNECFNKLTELGKNSDKKYIDELEEEARVKTVISEKLETNMFRYPNTLQHYIDMIWDCGSMVGAGRGSSCAALNHYLMGITQLDPIEWDLPFFRYLNDERVELGDIDIDICPSKRPEILRRIKEERGNMFNQDVFDWAKENLGCTLVATFGTEGTKSAIQTACRGYRSEEYPEGIDVDDAHYMSSLIPEERGFNWTIRDAVFGNAEKGRRPVKILVNELNKYPGLLDIILAIEGLIRSRGSHASGVILFDEDPFKYGSFMRTPKGDLITAFDLHDSEYCGLVKYDFLVTEVQDKLVQAIELLQADEEIEPELSLREVYDKYFHPNILPLEDNRIWDALNEVSVLNIFQFDSLVGSQVAKKLKPRTVLEMADCNGLMRLMGEEGQERPMDKYARFKENINLWYKEMDDFSLTKEEQKILEPYFKSSYGVPPSQEQLMTMLMDPNICGFTLGEANSARKVVGKKQMDKIPELKDKILSQATSPTLGRYVWSRGAGPQMGYSFSVIHALAYSFIGVQTLFIATNWNPIYWNTACLIVNSGATDPDAGGQTDYSKIAKAMGEIMNVGIKLSLVDINQSDYGFKPDAKNNQILYGMKAMLNVGDEIIEETIKNRPYTSIKDYLIRVKPKRQAMISLIKGGAFDNMMERKTAMAWYLWETCDKKKRLTLQNMPGLIKYNLLPEDTENKISARRIYEFNRYLKAVCKNKIDKENYYLDERAINFLLDLGYDDLIISYNNNYIASIKDWDKIYQVWMDIFRDWIAENKEEILQNLNEKIFLDDWNKYATGNISSWEMEALCFYYHKHELANVNMGKYGFVNFSDLPKEPVIDRIFKKGGKEIKIYKLYKICGTCIAKNKTKSTVSLLTTSGVVNVKFRKEYFSLFDKQISERGADGVKHIAEKSWFNRGNMITVMGIRSGDDFISKKYASSIGHQLNRITNVFDDGDITLQTERYKGEDPEDE